MDFTSGRVGMVRENHIGRQDFRERGMGHEQRQLRVSARRGKRRGEIPSLPLFGWSRKKILIFISSVLPKLTGVNLDNLRSHSHLRTLIVMVMVMRIGHGFLSCCRGIYSTMFNFSLVCAFPFGLLGLTKACHVVSCRIATFRNKLIDKWQRKTEVTTGAADIKSELHAFNQNISEQVASYIKDPSRMVGQMQMWKLAVAVFGTVTQSDAGAEVDGDPELLDDFELYQTTHHLLVKLLGHLILHT
ncbi:hypothetical protein DVH24_013715 [Malus domestica]|uniref:Uncharacterized protein n=1 Tax=Malus domestica TaxID=3750 RepID=A0A498JBF6_MALDO|nr:hypothetical protein DVH24_013715 [Malus domestica]